MKMIGVCADFLYWRISFAVSRPSMSGMLTSSRITANSRASTSRSASEPERTVTRFWPRSSRMLEKTSSFSGRSSTTRMLALSSLIAVAPLTRGESAQRTGGVGFPKTGNPPLPPVATSLSGGQNRAPSPMQPSTKDRQHMHAVDRLGQVVPGAGRNALLAVALHRLRGHRDDRQVGAALQFPDLLDGGDAVHLRHHDVH